MTLKQLIRYTNTPAIEATWVDENDVVIKCHAYSKAPEQMAMLRADLGADAAQYEDLIAEVEATYAPPVMPPIEQRLSAAREAIKAERDRRKFLGVKVGEHWFHSDDSSRIQQLALVMMGANIPPGLQWKVLTLTTPAFVKMTPSLAQAIFQATALSDQVIFAAAEQHRLAVEASVDPSAYDFSGGWPETIYD